MTNYSSVPEHGRGPDHTEARRAIEAVLMAASEPVEPRMLAELVELPVATVELLCATLAADYEREQRGYVIAHVAGGYRFQTHPDLAPYVERFVLDRQHARLSNAALETLAIVAYKQPVSRAQMASIRGVNVDAVVRTLEQRGYIEEVARDPGPGQAVLYGTTVQFLEQVGLFDLSELPALGDFVPGPEVMDVLESGLRLPSEVVFDDSEQHDEAAEVAESINAESINADSINADSVEGELDLTTSEPVVDLRTVSDELP